MRETDRRQSAMLVDGDLPQPAGGVLWRNLVALGIGSFLALALAEGALRVLEPPSVSIVRYPCIYRPDAATGFRYEPEAGGVIAAHFEFENHIRTNSLGFYDVEPGALGRGRPRVLAVGDSFTAAMNLPLPQVWTRVLERELRERGQPAAEVVNIGIDGTGTDAHAALLREYLPRLRPDVVVLAFYANDIGDVLRGRFERECYRDTVLAYQTPAQRDALRARVDDYWARPVARALHTYSYVVRLARAAVVEPINRYRVEFLQPRAREITATRDESRARVAALRRAFTEIAAIGRRCRCRLLVVPVPPRSDAEGSAQSLTPWVRGLSLEIVDPLPGVTRLREAAGLAHEDLYFRRDGHLNAIGNDFYARALAELLAADPASVP